MFKVMALQKLRTLLAVSLEVLPAVCRAFDNPFPLAQSARPYRRPENDCFSGNSFHRCRFRERQIKKPGMNGLVRSNSGLSGP
jgi:hypothetical protein